MQRFEDSLNQLEVVLLKFQKNQQRLIEENSELKSENSFIREQLYQTIKEKTKIEEENKKIKLVSAIAGNEEYRKLMKLKINKLIKELDSCILQIRNK